MRLGEALRSFRSQVNMKQDDAARHLGVSQAYISRLESGSAKPSTELEERILQLMETPHHRPAFEHWLAAVTHSPFLMMICSLHDGRVRIDAISKAYHTVGPPFHDYQPGFFISDELGAAAVRETMRLIRLGVFSGDVACVDGIWFSEHAGAQRYWRTVNVPVRNEAGDWFLQSSNIECTRAEYDARMEQHSDPLLVTLFGQPDPVPAHIILEG